MPSAPKVIRTGDDKIDRSLQSLASAVRELGEPVIESGIQLDSVAVSTSTSQVAHKLGRKYRGWWVVDRTADVRVWRDSSEDKTPELTIPIAASGSGSVSIWVY